jgi:hypothetical protein
VRCAAHGLSAVEIEALDATEAPDTVLDEAIEIATDAVQLPSAQDPTRLT